MYVYINLIIADTTSDNDRAFIGDAECALIDDAEWALIDDAEWALIDDDDMVLQNKSSMENRPASVRTQVKQWLQKEKQEPGNHVLNCIVSN